VAANPTSERGFRRYALPVLLVALAAAALALAILLPDALPHWLRRAMGLGKGDETAATPWLRGALVAFAFLLLLAGRFFDQVAWPDVAVIVVVVLAIAATVYAFKDAQRATKTEVAETAAFTIPAEKAISSIALPAKSAVILLVVEPDKADDGTIISYTATRYEAVLDAAVDAGPAQHDVPVTLERGEKDANVSTFGADLVGAETVYVLPGAKKKAKQKGEGGKGGKGDKKGPCRQTTVTTTTTVAMTTVATTTVTVATTRTVTSTTTVNKPELPDTSDASASASGSNASRADCKS
jgi:hypothetical protein